MERDQTSGNNSSANSCLDDTKNVNDISETEKRLLDESSDADENSDDRNLLRSQLDHTDGDGELLNEASSANNASGDDLDVPGAELDDENEQIGEEDEENNSYSDADTE